MGMWSCPHSPQTLVSVLHAGPLTSSLLKVCEHVLSRVIQRVFFKGTDTGDAFFCYLAVHAPASSIWYQLTWNSCHLPVHRLILCTTFQTVFIMTSLSSHSRQGTGMSGGLVGPWGSFHIFLLCSSLLTFHTHCWHLPVQCWGQFRALSTWGQNSATRLQPGSWVFWLLRSYKLEEERDQGGTGKRQKNPLVSLLIRPLVLQW